MNTVQEDRHIVANHVFGLLIQRGIAMDVGDDAVFFDNPELPDTHSEMALPLVSSSQVIGILDVQSTQRGAFIDEDVQMLSLLANQVSLAIENVRLFEETRRALSESEAVSRQTIRGAWRKLPAEQNLLGYRYTLTGAAPLHKPLYLPETETARTRSGQQETSQIVVPIELRGERIGSLIVQSPTTTELDQDRPRRGRTGRAGTNGQAGTAARDHLPHQGHVSVDPGAYRDAHEVERARQDNPLLRARALLDSLGEAPAVEAIEAEVRREIEHALATAGAAPWPAPEAAFMRT